MAASTLASPLGRGARITGAERERVAAELAARYGRGESIRFMADDLGRSYGWVQGLLKEAGVTLRGRGGATRGAAGAQRARIARGNNRRPVVVEGSKVPKEVAVAAHEPVEKKPKVKKPAKAVQAAKPDKPATIEKPAKVKKAEEPAKAKKAEEPAKVEKVDKLAKVKKADKPARKNKESAQAAPVEAPAQKPKKPKKQKRDKKSKKKNK